MWGGPNSGTVCTWTEEVLVARSIGVSGFRAMVPKPGAICNGWGHLVFVTRCAGPTEMLVGRRLDLSAATDISGLPPGQRDHRWLINAIVSR